MDMLGISVVVAESIVSQYTVAYFMHPERHSFRSWFVRIPKQPKDTKKTKELLGFIVDVVIAFACGEARIPVLWKWGGWFICFCVFLYIIQSSVDYIGERPLKTRLLGGVLFSLLVAAIAWPKAMSMRMEERAAVLTGELCSSRSNGICYSPPQPIIEISDSGTTFFYIGTPDYVEMGKFAHNVGLRIERGEHGVEVTTPLLDRTGKKILSIKKNHWTVVPQPGIWDKNYTENALEIKDSRDEVVFQIKFLPDRIQIAAEWRDEFGRGQEWSKCSEEKNGEKSLLHGRPVASCISPWGNPVTELQNEKIIEPIFQYPSKEHLGEFVKKH